MREITIRTCPKCGCYIPDLWDTCPACSVVKETTTKPVRYPDLRKDSVGIYRVDVLYDYERDKSSEYFGIYENAEKYALRRSHEADVYATQIIYRGKIVKVFSTNY